MHVLALVHGCSSVVPGGVEGVGECLATSD